jgi:hypothetical protein
MGRVAAPLTKRACVSGEWVQAALTIARVRFLTAANAHSRYSNQQCMAQR